MGHGSSDSFSREASLGSIASAHRWREGAVALVRRVWALTYGTGRWQVASMASLYLKEAVVGGTSDALSWR